MSLFDDLKENFAKPFVELHNTEIKPIVTPSVNPQKLLEDIKKPAQPVAKFGNSEGAINSLLSALIAQSGNAPGTTLDRDLTAILSWAGLETTLGALTELSPSIAFLIEGTVRKLSEAVLIGNYRDLEYIGNYRKPNRQVNVDVAVSAFFRGIITKSDLTAHLQKEGFNTDAVNHILETTHVLNNLGNLINLRFRGEIETDEEFFKRAIAIGVPKNEAEDAQKAARPLLNAGEGVTMWRRGLKVEGDKDAFSDLRRQGFTEARIEAIKAMSHTLPNIFEIQDFKVREVDNPEIVNKFQLDAFIDEDYFAQAQKLGYDRKTAQQIYRYFWNVPSLFLVRELYTTGQLTEQDFRDLLKFSRFTPYWIDRLATQLKPALKIGDIEKMYKYQVIKAEDIVPQLEKIGFTPQLAADHAKIIIASTKLAASQDQTAAQAAAGKVKEDTATLIMRAYKDRVVSRQIAKEHLLKLNFTEDHAELQLTVTDYESHQDEIKALFTLLKEQYAAGQIDVNRAINKLVEAGASTAQLDLYTAEFTKLSEHKPVIPTLAKIETWFKKNIIDLNQFVAGLRMLGYADVWIPYYLMEVGISADDINALNLQGQTALSQ